MNSSRMNKLEELGRVDAEKADTSKGKRNLSDEKSRIVRELKADGGKVKKRKKAGPDAGKPSPQRKMGRGARSSKKKEKPSMVVRTGVAEGPAKQNTTIKTFKIYPKDTDGQNIKIKKFAKGGMVTVSGRGQGKVMPGRNKKTYIC